MTVVGVIMLVLVLINFVFIELWDDPPDERYGGEWE